MGREGWPPEKRAGCEMRMGMRGRLTLRIRNEAWGRFDGGEGLEEDGKERKHITREGRGKMEMGELV